MTETVDLLIQARFDAVTSTADDRDWNDVLLRLRNARPVPREPRRRLPRRLVLAAAAVALALAVTAVGFGWPGSVIDFFSSPPAPDNVKNWFGAENVSAPSGMSPGAIPSQARKITTERFDVNHLHGGHPTVHTLYVAPRKGGGFCYLWTNSGAGCLPPKGAPRSLGPLGLDWFSGDYAVLVDGWVRTGATRTVEARFADGTTATIPVTWVSAPVDAGFLIYPVPRKHQTRADALRSIVALDASGKVLGKQSFPVTKKSDEDVLQTLPDGTKYMLPRSEDAARARKVISFRSTNGHPIYLWLIPHKGGGVCFLYNRGGGCKLPRFEARLPILNGGTAGSTSPPILLFEQAKPQVAAVVLRYQNGESERLTPVDGFVLHEIAPAHYKRGTRLAAAVALDRSGHPIYTQRFRPQEWGVYPCKKPVDRGYGVTECP
ncbi:MAG TPA: hypothetical protein VJ814_10645 [Gaiellaceae bacterium]|nr:hypothetical protein [Gaiellaceae bacterium]